MNRIVQGLFALIVTLALTACGGGGGGGSSRSSAPPSDTTPDAFAFVDQENRPVSSVITSASVTVTGINQPTPISVSGGAYSIGCGANFTESTGNINAGQSVCVRHTSAATSTTDTNTTLTIGGVTDTFTSRTAASPTAQPSSVILNVVGVAASSTTGTIGATDPASLTLTYSISSPPQRGTASVSTTSGAFTYSLPGHTSVTSDSFIVNVSNGRTPPVEAKVTVQLMSDPLLQNQWHIQNVGQDAFSSTAPVAGNDMNVATAWAGGVSGQGIKVAVVDSGLEGTHADIAANFDLLNSFNFLTGGSDPARLSTDPGFDHGTAVAGIIGATAYNGSGGRGVAFGARLRGYNLIAPGAFSVVNMAKSFGGDPISADSDIINASFGAVAPALPTFSGAFQAITSNTLTLRGGLGAPIVNAASNDFEDWGISPGTGLCAAANHYGVSCGDPANDERRGGYAPIIVGAIDADGRHSSYSDTGSSLWIAAPGGEYGLNSDYTAVGPNFAPAVVTTSRTGCANYTVAVNPLDSLGANPLAPDCEYTAKMNGTSSATPNVAGVVALMLEANPNLTVRDVKFILAKTARKVDATFAGVTATDIVPDATVTLEQGWVTNSAGWSFSNRYGFGAVDASAAVAMAKSYDTTLVPPLAQSTGNYEFIAAPPATIPKQSLTGGFIQFPVAESFNTVEAVIVFLNIASTPGLVCNQVELTSPSGTKSILLHAANGFANASVVYSRILSNAFYGESVNGTWTLTFFDFCDTSFPSTNLSTIDPQILLFTGQ